MRYRPSLLLRAIVAAADVDSACGGDPSLIAVPAGAVAAVATAHKGTSAAADADTLLEHHRIVQSIFERVPCLPARFGGVFADDRALSMQLAKREQELASALARVGARCELAITLGWRDEGANVDEARAEVPASGREYLERGRSRVRARERREERASALASRLLEELAIDPAFVRHQTCPRAAVAVSMSVLVTREEIARLRSRIEHLGPALRDVTTVVQGPWPPYTFAVTA